MAITLHIILTCKIGPLDVDIDPIQKRIQPRCEHKEQVPQQQLAETISDKSFDFPDLHFSVWQSQQFQVISFGSIGVAPS